jgi:hypothetical protein
MAQTKTVMLEVEATDRGYVSDINKWRAARNHDQAVRQGILYPPGRQLTPLERLLLEINDPMTTDKDRWRAIELALPYCHAPKADNPAHFEFGELRTAKEMLAAQRRIMKSVGEGKTPPQIGKMLVESLAVMIRCLDTTNLEDRLEAVEAQTNSGTMGRPVLAINNPRLDTDP